MILFTRGEPAEQAGKVERSGLQGFFDAIEIIAEKSTEAYDELVRKHHVVKSHGWLVGNSPSSDILARLAGGPERGLCAASRHLGTGADGTAGGTGKLLIVSSFRDLRDHF